ncbi:MAG TPA: hypothetical protein VKK61_07075, partial [Tepidisphaeraceae bacterium]|nr:hypothetical protein [Tepidisphaeraceae bacterium]
ARLSNDENERRRLARGAMRRIHDFSWEQKAASVDAIYRRKISTSAGQSRQIQLDENRALAA